LPVKQPLLHHLIELTQQDIIGPVRADLGHFNSTLSDTRPFSLDQSPNADGVPQRKTIAPEHFLNTYGKTTLTVQHEPVTTELVEIQKQTGLLKTTFY
jgi:hypothetical protein